MKDKGYYQHTYQLSPPHSEVVELMHHLQTAEELKDAPLLDLGCGRGRNALFLQDHGYTVHAMDRNADALMTLDDIIKKEDLKSISVSQYNVNSCTLPVNTYSAIVSTVVLMFVDQEKIDDIVLNMQEATKPGGLNLIVVAMDTEKHPCTMGFSSPFQERQLEEYYAGWEIIKYNEHLGALHRVDASGNPVQLQFATIVARKKA